MNATLTAVPTSSDQIQRDCLAALAHAVASPTALDTIAARVQAACHRYDVHIDARRAKSLTVAVLRQHQAETHTSDAHARAYFAGNGFDELVRTAVAVQSLTADLAPVREAA